jgi:hypothetical protein
MRRFVLPLLFIATTAFAQVRGRAVMPPFTPANANTVSGTVSSVSGSLITLANGLISIDTTGAKIIGYDVITPGSFVTATLKSGDVAPNAPLPATLVLVVHLPQATLSGTVTSVDIVNNKLTLLGRTINVRADTNFSGLLTLRKMTFADIFPSMVVAVEANVVNGALTAESVEVLTPLRIAPARFTGFVKSIGATQWTVGLGPAGSLAPDFLVAVDKNTTIVGDPKVGDRVNVVGELTATGFAASSITRVP